MRFHRYLSIIFSAAALSLAVAPAITHASVVIGATRVIYEAASGEKTVRLTNKSQAPSLVQAWLDTGASQAERSTLEVPFVVSPPMSRIDPGKSQTLRIMHSGEPLPPDRESIFWLNVLDIPARPNAKNGENFLQLSFRSRIKFFFRPAGLAGTAMQAPQQLTWQLAGEGNRAVLRVSNPTPYHVSFAAVELASGEKTLAVKDPAMVAPFETRTLELPTTAMASTSMRVRYQFINDYGGISSGEAALQEPVR
ncbi:fimbria/pilus periplasmic chaperone [Bordetella petrii]|uniref:fimbria/pilus periplasmic chaperone n=1 Tax=Bordetella petrii TaxID=94624 RepID=UPI001A963ACC|nr:fimbria/pilus periplasmic chaperone [Bordetella petrii]MBO1114225.1 fimbria/pilus periplasmic chaperone [Bordetella petrii]